MPLVRKARCPACGAAKSTPSASPYLYCDFCGQLMDLDLERYRAQAPVPSDGYRELEARMEPVLAAARARRDRAALMAAYRELRDRWVTDMAAMFSPRIKDPAFRARQVEYLAYQDVVRDLSDRLAPIAETLDRANTGLDFVERGGRYVLAPKTLWPVIDAQREAAAIYRECLASFDEPVPDPDDTPPEVVAALAATVYVGGFLTMVDDATAAELLRRTGLTAEYEQVPDPELCRVFCGHCGAPHEQVVGARRVLCESCGKHAEVGTTARCHGCGAPVVIGLGRTAATCAHCTADVRLVPALS